MEKIEKILANSPEEHVSINNIPACVTQMTNDWFDYPSSQLMVDPCWIDLVAFNLVVGEGEQLFNEKLYSYNCKLCC